MENKKTKLTISGTAKKSINSFMQALMANAQVAFMKQDVYPDFESKDPLTKWLEKYAGEGDDDQVIRSVLGRLPEKELMVIQLYYVEELNIYEIAEILNICHAGNPFRRPPTSQNSNT